MLRRRARRGSRPEFSKADSGRWIDLSGRVLRLLSDDNDGSRHQRFILSVRHEQTLLIAHNIDLVERVPVALGDRIEFRGMYEWNELGGLVHWTHHDPMGIEDGGYILHRGQKFR